MLRILLASVVAALLAACAGPGLTRLEAGIDETALRQRWGEPTGRYQLPAGTRLEYATGPYGWETWMVDLDAAGRVMAWNQVLGYGRLSDLQMKLPQMNREQLLLAIGRPGERRSGGRQGGQVWSWRFDSPFCLWFQVGVADDGSLRGGAFTPDPLCDGPDDDRQ
jgi:hypothetical protein